MSPDEVLEECWRHIPLASCVRDVTNIRIAARFAWERKEMAGLEHVQFAHRNGTPIVPLGHCCHPIELVKRGYIDGKGWPKKQDTSVRDRVKLFKWPDGSHWYASLDGEELILNGVQKWNTPEQAMRAAETKAGLRD